MRSHSLVLSQRSFINFAQQRMSNNSILASYQLSPMNKPLDESSFFQSDPNVPIVEVEDILKLIKFGKFHMRLIIFHMICFITSALLAFNFAFFLMRPVYNCTYLDPISNTTAVV
jgi:hypothetical protein